MGRFAFAFLLLVVSDCKLLSVFSKGVALNEQKGIDQESEQYPGWQKCNQVCLLLEVPDDLQKKGRLIT